MPEYRAYLIGLDGHFINWLSSIAATISVRLRKLSSSSTATSWSFGALIAGLPASIPSRVRYSNEARQHRATGQYGGFARALLFYRGEQ